MTWSHFCEGFFFPLLVMGNIFLLLCMLVILDWLLDFLKEKQNLQSVGL